MLAQNQRSQKGQDVLPHLIAQGPEGADIIIVIDVGSEKHVGQQSAEVCIEITVPSQEFPMNPLVRQEQMILQAQLHGQMGKNGGNGDHRQEFAISGHQFFLNDGGIYRSLFPAENPAPCHVARKGKEEGYRQIAVDKNIQWRLGKQTQERIAGPRKVRISCHRIIHTKEMAKNHQHGHQTTHSLEIWNSFTFHAD